MNVVPQPGRDDIPFNEPTSVELSANQQATVTFSPVQQVSEFVLPALAISKAPDSIYQVWLDDEVVFGPATVPPTDVDDLVATWLPARRFERELKVQITNTGTSTRNYAIQPVGYEVSNGT